VEWTERIEVGDKDGRNRFIRKAKNIIAQWGFKMPDEYLPLLLDFGLGNFLKTGHIEYWIVNDEGNGYCGKFIFMFKGQTCPAHSHKRKHETFMVVKGVIRMSVNGKIIKMNPGQVLKMSQGSIHSFTAEKNSLILEVSMPSIRNDNLFKDEKIGII